MNQVFNKPNLKKKRQSLRNDMTPFEKILWNKLRGKQFFGIKWRRQHSVGNYILDFYSSEIKTCIEIDGDSHATSLEYDNKRTLYLNELGIKVIRYTNGEIRNIISLDSLYLSNFFSQSFPAIGDCKKFCVNTKKLDN